jgi:hypothetical protein
MAALGNLGGSMIGALNGHTHSSIPNGPITYTMPTANNGWAARFTALDSRDIKSVSVSFNGVTAPGTIEARIETIDATTGKPTGTLYDAAATKSFTPSVGWNTVTFDTLPTTGLTAGSSYALVLLKTNTGTTCTLNARVSATSGIYPVMVLTASDISTRSNFAEVANSVPFCYFTFEDDVVESLGFAHSVAAGTGNFFAADTVAALKIVLPVACVVRAIWSQANSGFARTGTPAGDLRMRILDSGNSAISGTTFTIDKDELTNFSTRGLFIPLNNISLAAGTYRIAFDSSGSANSSNCFGLRYATLPDAALQSSSFCYSESTNASTSFTWTDFTTRQVPLGLLIDSITASGGSGSSYGFFG